MMPKGVLIAAVAVGAIGISVAIVVMTLQFAVKSDPHTDPTGAATIQGTVVCLPHKDTSGPQTLECALGVKDGKGRHYSLKDTDSSYKNLQTLPTGKEVRVHGTLSASLDIRYDTAGTIEVSKVEIL